MLFMRIYLDLSVDCARRGALLPTEWTQAMQTCMSHANSAEREHYEELMVDSRKLEAQVRPPVAASAQSVAVEERMLFVRSYIDKAMDCARRGEVMPSDWRQSLETCLGEAKPAEREHYFELMADSHVLEAKLRAVAQPLRAPVALATRQDLDAVLRVATLDEAIALARDSRARLRPEHLETLVARALKLAETGERRLVAALLARTPVRVQMAPLFLEATPKQRNAILLAAQRDELGRAASAPTKLDAETGARLEFAAVTGERAEFGKTLAEALDIAPELAWRIAEDRGGEPLSIALAAMGAPRDLTVRVITALDMREGDAFPRIHAFAGLADQISFGAARRIVGAITGAPVAPSAATAPGRAATRALANPSPFLRRETPERRQRLIQETSIRQALNSRRP